MQLCHGSGLIHLLECVPIVACCRTLEYFHILGFCLNDSDWIWSFFKCLVSDCYQVMFQTSSVTPIAFQAPETSRGNVLQSSGQPISNDSPPASYWKNIIENLDGFLDILKQNFVCSLHFLQNLLKIVIFVLMHVDSLLLFQVPPILCQKMFIQIYSYINMQLFNRYQLLLSQLEYFIAVAINSTYEF